MNIPIDGSHNDIAPELLQAYIDGDADPALRERLDAAFAADPALRAAFDAAAARDARMRARLREAFDPALDAPVPAHLLALLAGDDAPHTSEMPAAEHPVAAHAVGEHAVGEHAVAEHAVTAHGGTRSGGEDPTGRADASAPGASVTSLSTVRSARASEAEASSRTRHAPRRWLPLAAAAAVGVLAVGLWLRTQAPNTPWREDNGVRIATGALADGLDQALASEPRADDAVRIGLSFRDRDGRWCRSFTLPAEALAGLACRRGGDWELVASAALDVPPADGDALRQASADLPAEVLDAIDARIDGDAALAEQERAARETGWR